MVNATNNSTSTGSQDDDEDYDVETLFIVILCIVVTAVVLPRLLKFYLNSALGRSCLRTCEPNIDETSSLQLAKIPEGTSHQAHGTV
jgi:hypothetical protein